MGFRKTMSNWWDDVSGAADERKARELTAKVVQEKLAPAVGMLKDAKDEKSAMTAKAAGSTARQSLAARVKALPAADVKTETTSDKAEARTLAERQAALKAVKIPPKKNVLAEKPAPAAPSFTERFFGKKTIMTPEKRAEHKATRDEMREKYSLPAKEEEKSWFGLGKSKP